MTSRIKTFGINLTNNNNNTNATNRPVGQVKTTNAVLGKAQSNGVCQQQTIAYDAMTMTKKRTAFENLTNSTTANTLQVQNNANGCPQKQTLTCAATTTTTSNLTNKDMNKKSRTTTTSSTAATASSTAKAKKIDSTSTTNKKTTTTNLTRKASSKENVNGPGTYRKGSDSKAMAAVAAAANKQAKQPFSQPQAEAKASKTVVTRSEKMEISQSMSNVNINQVQILEPIRFVDSTESLASSTGSLNIDPGTQATGFKHNSSAAESFPGWEDIDAEDRDEFSCSDYVAQIFKYYREREEKFSVDDYLKRQPNINKQMRLLLVDWMVEVQQQLEFNHEVLYLSVKLLDLYLNRRKIEKEKLQLLGGAAMFIACKFEERMPPIIDDFIYVSDNAYDRNELIKMEIDILKTVKFDIGIPLSYTFLRRYSKCVKADMRFLTLARYILELSLQDYTFANERDSLKACAALYLALRMAVTHEDNMKNIMLTNPDIVSLDQLPVSTANLTSTEWNATLIHYTGSFVADFAHLLPSMNNLVKTAAMSRYKTIYKKYSHQVFYEVARIPHLDDAQIEQLVRMADTV